MSKRQIACLSKFLAEKESDETVSIEKFSLLLKWFGPLNQNGRNIMDRVEAIVKKPWFFGGLSSLETEQNLSQYSNKPGTFLVRLNMGGNEPIDKTPFTISRIDQNGFVHTRVYPLIDGGGFIAEVTKKGKEKVKIQKDSPNLDEFIVHIQNSLPDIFSEICPGHPFRRIFSDEGVGLYEARVDD